MELRDRINSRLRHYDYSTCGAYFVTICTHKRKEILSKIRRGDPCGRPEIQVSRLGWIVAETFPRIAEKFNVIFDTWVIMPDHIHFVVFLPEQGVTVGRIVGAFKSIVSREWLVVCKAENRLMGEIWQRNYYEHVIRNDEDLTEIRRYIAENPARWLEGRQMLGD